MVDPPGEDARRTTSGGDIRGEALIPRGCSSVRCFLPLEDKWTGDGRRSQHLFGGNWIAGCFEGANRRRDKVAACGADRQQRARWVNCEH